MLNIFTFRTMHSPVERGTRTKTTLERKDPEGRDEIAKLNMLFNIRFNFSFFFFFFLLLLLPFGRETDYYSSSPSVSFLHDSTKDGKKGKREVLRCIFPSISSSSPPLISNDRERSHERSIDTYINVPEIVRLSAVLAQ